MNRPLGNVRSRTLGFLMAAALACVAGGAALGAVDGGGGDAGLQQAIRAADTTARAKASAGRGELASLGAERGAVAFPAGTSYADAVTQIYVAQQTGTQPANARLVAGLPKGQVVDQRPDGLVVDLRAPFGYDVATGFPYTATLLMSESLTPAEVSDAWAAAERSGRPWPRGASVGVPDLPACMTVTGRACSTDDLVVIRSGVKLP
jgi:hypothetical protein